VKIPLDAPTRPVDVGAGDFTLELWLKMEAGDNTASFACSGGNDDWINGNIFLDRDIFGAGDFGDFGASLSSNRVMFGVANSSTGVTACGATDLADGLWHHLALTRRASDGRVEIYIDGGLDGFATGPTGNLSYRDGRSGATNDPFLVLGAEKHDAGAAYPSYNGLMDELRISTVRRYTGTFTPPGQPFVTDVSTVGLYHFDEAAGTVLGDTSGASGGPSNGELREGGSPVGPVWSAESPFGQIFADGFESGDTSAWTATVP
jgi:Concanavalin A-like lectin/glucanases superfamily